MPTLSPNLLPGHAADMPLKPPLQAAQPDLFSKMKNRTLRLRLHEPSDIMALSQQRGCHHGEITASA